MSVLLYMFSIPDTIYLLESVQQFVKDEKEFESIPYESEAMFRAL